MPYVFHDVCDNAFTKALDGQLDNVQSPVSVSVNAGEGARFTPDAGTWLLTICSEATPPENPYLDPDVEECVATRIGDLLTLTRPNPKAHAGKPWIQLLILDENVKELQAAATDLDARTSVLEGVARHWQVEPSGIVEGAVDVFLPFVPTTGTERGYRNGSRMRRGAGKDYTIVGAAVTLAEPIRGDGLGSVTEDLFFDFEA